jgi:type III restriction enzyme
VFIVVCNNTTNSELITTTSPASTGSAMTGPQDHPPEWPPRIVPELRRTRQPPRRPRTLLIDSAQIESGGQIDDKFKEMAAGPEIEAVPP